MWEYPETYDVIVVGGGHAGCEAALAAARMGAKVLLLNLYLDNLVLMACNPAVGGPGKGHLTREIDALGGEQALATDASAVHMRMLNTSKGIAVRSLRAQCDLRDYHVHYRSVIERTEGIDLHQGLVEEVVLEGRRVRGVGTSTGTLYRARAVILATGTYLGGKVHIGLHSFPSGPLGQMPALGLSRSLRAMGLEVGRLKTGTPPRIHADSVDYGELEEQPSMEEPDAFSLWSEPRVYRGYSCYLTRTNREIHELILENLDRSPLFSGAIEGIGPRYCPSIEDKVVKFPHKESHPVFLEPTGRWTKELYMQNFSSSMPFDVQVRMVRMLPGCRRAKVMRPAYAIEYDFCPPTQLYPWLEVKSIEGLFLAGQINGTSGYEEAAAQGLMAGINAVLRLRGEEPLVLDRSQAYIGVLIDDLVTKGTSEPYRILTSRAEHRLLLRFDNADLRLTPIGRRLGLIDDGKWELFSRRKRAIEEAMERISSAKVHPSDAVNELLRSKGTKPIEEPTTLKELLRRPQIGWEDLLRLDEGLRGTPANVGLTVEAEVKYEGYAERQRREVERLKRMSSTPIPEWIDYDAVPGLLSEAREKLKKVRPLSLGQASRIPGVTPADLAILAVYVESARKP